MFLWCGCHCNPEPPSESFPSEYGSSEPGSSTSQSVDSAGPPQVPVIGCVPCRFGIAPSVFEFEWNYQGQAVKPFPPRPCCPSYTTQKKYRLYAREAPPNQCIWTSNELIRGRRLEQRPFPQFPEWVCFDGTAPRVVLTLATAGQLRPFAELVVYYAEGYPPQVPQGLRFTPTRAVFIAVDANGIPIPAPEVTTPTQNRFLCLQQMRFRASWSLDNRPRTWIGSSTFRGEPFGSPCDQDSFSMIDSGLPEYITCTPVSA